MGWAQIAAAIAQMYQNYRNRRSQERANQANEDYAKNQVSYRVADANRAGIHPLAALGMSDVGPMAQGTIMEGMPEAAQGLASIKNIREEKKDRDEERRWQLWLNSERLSNIALENDMLQEDIKNKRLQRLMMKNPNADGSPDRPFRADIWYEYTNPDGTKAKFPVLNEQAAEGMEGKAPRYVTGAMNIQHGTAKQFFKGD